MSSSADQAETTVAAACFCFCSIGMMYFNKLAIDAFPLECSLVALQMAFAALALLTFGWHTLHIGSVKDLLRWCMVVPFFVALLLTSILALKHASMSLVIVLRAMSPLGSMVIERFYPNPLKINTAIVMSIMTMVVGCALYCSKLRGNFLNGVTLVILNSLIAVADRLVQRYLLSKDQNPVDISKPAVTMINNAFGCVPLFIAAYCTGEFSDMPAAIARLTLWDEIVICLSCIIGLGISYTGIWVVSLMSATSMLVLTNANKFVIIGIEAYGLHAKTLGPLQTVGACVTIMGACMYGQARQAIEAAEQERKPILPQNVSEKA